MESDGLLGVYTAHPQYTLQTLWFLKTGTSILNSLQELETSKRFRIQDSGNVSKYNGSVYFSCKYWVICLLVLCLLTKAMKALKAIVVHIF